MNLKIIDVEPMDLILATSAAILFLQEGKPIGLRHGIGYRIPRPSSADGYLSLYVYQTQTMVVVQGNK